MYKNHTAFVASTPRFLIFAAKLSKYYWAVIASHTCTIRGYMSYEKSVY